MKEVRITASKTLRDKIIEVANAVADAAQGQANNIKHQNLRNPRLVELVKTVATAAMIEAEKQIIASLQTRGGGEGDGTRQGQDREE